MVKIFLDPGHGGHDPGATGNELQEKNVALDLTLRIEQKLQAYQNINIKLSRNDDTFLTLSERTDIANLWGADCFLSLHLNSTTNKAVRGFESFIYNGPVQQATQALQNVLHEEIIKKIGKIISVDRGKKRANFHVLRESNMPAILGENLFVSSASDANLLKSNSFLDTLAQGYVTGLEKFFGLELKSPPIDETPVTESDLWQVIAGTYANRDNADEQVKRLLKDGYNAYVLKKE
jgi:N-acetylmuramoyl-L-alanine amidase